MYCWGPTSAVVQRHRALPQVNDAAPWLAATLAKGKYAKIVAYIFLCIFRVSNHFHMPSDFVATSSHLNTALLSRRPSDCWLQQLQLTMGKLLRFSAEKIPENRIEKAESGKGLQQTTLHLLAIEKLSRQ